MGRWQSGQLHQTVNLASSEFGGSNPSLPNLGELELLNTICGVDFVDIVFNIPNLIHAGVAQR